MRRVVLFAVLLCVLNSCGTQIYVPARIVRGDSPGALGFVPVAGGWLLLRCNTDSDLHAYTHKETSHEREQEGHDHAEHKHNAVITDNEPCYAVLEQVFTTAELAVAEQRIVADLHHDERDRAAQLSFAAVLAVLSLPISQAIVANFTVSIPITLGVGVAFYHIHRKVQQIVSLQWEMEVAVAELRNPSAQHNSNVSLTIVEEVLLRYLTSAPPHK